MGWVEIKKQTLRLREKAEKEGMPVRFLNLVDHYINKSIFFRNHKDTKATPTDYRYDRAMDLLLSAQAVLYAYLYDRYKAGYRK